MLTQVFLIIVLVYFLRELVKKNPVVVNKTKYQDTDIPDIPDIPVRRPRPISGLGAGSGKGVNSQKIKPDNNNNPWTMFIEGRKSNIAADFSARPDQMAGSAFLRNIDAPIPPHASARDYNLQNVAAENTGYRDTHAELKFAWT